MQIGLASDAVPRPEKAQSASVLPIKGMGVVGSMEVPALVQGPRKDVLGSLRLTYGMVDIPKTS